MPLSEHKIYVQHLLIPNDALLIPAGLLLDYTIERLECVSLLLIIHWAREPPRRRVFHTKAKREE